jgi:hypothetical protein
MAFDREFIEASLALGLIPSDAMPAVAWDALEAGLDGPAIRRLAALEQPTAVEVAEVLPKVKTEMGLMELTASQAALRIARQLAAEILKKGEVALCCARQFEWLWIRAGFPQEIESVGTMNDDVQIAYAMGQTPSEVREWVTERLRALGA